MSNLQAMKKAKRHDGRTFQEIAEGIHDDFYGSYANRMKVVDVIVNNSREGSCPDWKGQDMVDELFAQRETMEPATYKAAVDALGCYLQNNLQNGVANNVYHNFVCDERCMTPEKIEEK